MQLSNKNFVKHAQVTQAVASKEIVTKVKEKVVVPTFLPQLDESLELTESAQLLRIEQQKIDQMRQSMLQDIQERAKQSEAEAFEKGYQEGLTQGQEQGYLQGLEQAKAEASHYTELAKSNLQEANQEIQADIKQQTQQLVQFSIKLAETLTEVTIDTNTEVIANKIIQFIEELDHPQELVIVRVHANQVEAVRQAIKEQQSAWPHAKISVLKEVNLTEYDYSIETDDDFTLFDLKTELTKFLDLLIKDDQ